MKIFDAVYTAAVLLQLDELYDAMSADGFNSDKPNDSLDEDCARDLDILLRCCNLVLDELIRSDFPLVASTTIETDGKRITYNRLPTRVLEILSVEHNGKKLPMQVYYDGVTVPVEGKCKVVYALAPYQVQLTSTSPYPIDRPSARLLAYGIAREYCLISGMTENAAVWDNRYIVCLQEETSTRRAKTVRPRVWR